MNGPHRPHEPPLSNELRSVEAMLASLTPRGDRLDQEQLWFEAGRRAAMDAMPAPNGRWAIAGSAAVSAAVGIAATLLVMFWTRPPTQFVERVRVVEVPVVRASDHEPKRESEPPTPVVDEPPSDRGAPPPLWTNIDRPNSLVPRGSRAAQIERMAMQLRHRGDLGDAPLRATTANSRRASTAPHEPPTVYQQRQDFLGDETGQG